MCLFRYRNRDPLYDVKTVVSWSATNLNVEIGVIQGFVDAVMSESVTCIIAVQWIRLYIHLFTAL